LWTDSLNTGITAFCAAHLLQDNTRVSVWWSGWASW